jgi:hypothetical protein
VLDRAARGAAGAAARALTLAGTEASVTQRVLRVGDVQYLITPECVTTPLLAFYLAAILASALSWRARVLGVVTAVPLFSALAVLRLMTVAAPSTLLGSTLIVTHAFNQILTGAAALVVASIWWRAGGSRARAVVMALIAIACAAVASVALGPALASGWAKALATMHVSSPHGLTPVAGDGDMQGAMMVLPIYQVALLAASWMVLRHRAPATRWIAAFVVLLASQFVFLGVQGWMDAEGIRPLSALWIRGWAVAIPLLLVLAVCRRPKPVPTDAMEPTPA